MRLLLTILIIFSASTTLAVGFGGRQSSSQPEITPEQVKRMDDYIKEQKIREMEREAGLADIEEFHLKNHEEKRAIFYDVLEDIKKANKIRGKQLEEAREK